MDKQPVKKVPIHLQSAQNRLIIKNGTVVNCDGEEQIDVYIEDSMIRMVGQHLIIPGGSRSIDATGMYIMPGGIDTNVHLQRPTGDTMTIDNFYNGTKAALAGGTTMVVDMVVPDEEETLKEAYDKWRRWADDKVCCDYNLKMGITRVDDDIKQEMEELTGAEYGINTFMTWMSGRGNRLTDPQLLEVFDAVGKMGGLAMVHAENGDIVADNERRMMAAGVSGPEGHAMAHPEEAEVVAVMSACVLAGQVDCPVYITSLTSQAAADIVKKRKDKGGVVFSEVTPACLACEGTNYWNKCWRHAAGFVCSPPLRDGETDNLLDAVTEGRFDTIASHHKTFNTKQKALGKDNFINIPAGVNGVEERLKVLWSRGVHSGKMKPSEFVAMTSSTPAKMLNIFPQKGKIAVGSDADIVIWDPNLTTTPSTEEHVSKCDFNIFEGVELHGGPEYVICKGRLVLDQGTFRPMQGFGQYVEVPPFSPFIYDKVRAAKETVKMQPVARSDQDMAVTNGTGDIPPASPPDEEEKPTNQQKSSFDLNSHPDTPDFDSVRSSPSRSSVRVRAPPGGNSSGFW